MAAKKKAIKGHLAALAGAPKLPGGIVARETKFRLIDKDSLKAAILGDDTELAAIRAQQQQIDSEMEQSIDNLTQLREEVKALQLGQDTPSRADAFVNVCREDLNQSVLSLHGSMRQIQQQLSESQALRIKEAAEYQEKFNELASSGAVATQSLTSINAQLETARKNSDRWPKDRNAMRDLRDIANNKVRKFEGEIKKLAQQLKDQTAEKDTLAKNKQALEERVSKAEELIKDQEAVIETPCKRLSSTDR